MSPIVSQGIELAVYGMGVVFVFLTLLIFATMMMSRLVQMTSSVEVSSPVPASSPAIPAKKMAAVAAAVHQHRNQQPG